MAFNRETTNVLGWAYEAAAETDPINAVNALYWKPGVDASQYSLPLETKKITPYYDGSTRDPVALKINRTEVIQALSFWPTNAIPLYMYLGEASSAAGVHTITGLDSGSLDTFTIRSENRGGDTSEYLSAVGSKCTSLAISFDNTGQNLPLGMGLGYQGIKRQTATLNEIHTTGTKYPTDDYTMTGTENDDLYRYDSNLVFTWDHGGSAEDYKDALLTFNYQGTNLFNVPQLSNQAEIEYIHEGHRQHIVNFSIIRGQDSALPDDIKAGTQHDILFKIYNTSTNYLQLVLDDSLGSLTKSKYFNANKEEVPTWLFEGMCESVTCTAKDGCSTTFYGL